MEGPGISDVTYENPRRSLRNPDLSAWIAMVGEVLARFGWALLLLCSALYLLVKFLKRRGPVWASEEPAPLTEGRAEALEAARRRMQEELDSRAALYRDRMRQQEEEKRRQKTELLENMQRGRSCRETQASEAAGSSSVPKPKKDKKSLRGADYSPLSGQGGGSCSWRPGRRGPSSGG